MDYIYEGEGYTIRVKGKKIAEPADMNAEVEIQQKEDALQFALKHEGELPVKGIICTFKDRVSSACRTSTGMRCSRPALWTVC